MTYEDERGRWKIRWKMESWKMDEMEDGRWKMEDGSWKMEDRGEKRKLTFVY